MPHPYDFGLRDHFDLDRIKATIPPECPVDLGHARLHYANAERELAAGDIAQAVHELSLACRLLFVLQPPEDTVAVPLETLDPPCCHVTGMHDPLHYQEGRGVCKFQKAEAYDAIRAAAGLGPVTPEDTVSKTDCSWCSGDGCEYPGAKRKIHAGDTAA